MPDVATEDAPTATCVISVGVLPASASKPRAAELEPSGYVEDDADLSAEPIDAGSDIVLLAIIETAPPRDLTGLAIEYRDGDGEILGTAAIETGENGVHRVAPLAAKAPLAPGDYTWQAILPAHQEDDAAFAEVVTPFAFSVTSHKATIVVWDLPTAIIAGDEFRFKVGVKCSSGCPPTDWTFEIRDAAGAVVAGGPLGDVPWQGTAALYWAEVSVRAPGSPGLHEWTASAPGPGAGIAHQARSARVGVRSVPKPDCSITVEAIDQETQTPIRGARVVIHPYRVFTDEHGRAEVRVPKGTYRIFVSGGDHFPYREESEIVADTVVRAELAMDRPPTVADVWS